MTWTAREICRELVLWKRKEHIAREKAISIAWHTANLTRAAELPKLMDYLHAGRPQTEAEREAVWLQIAAVHGLEVRVFDKKNPKRRIIRAPRTH